MIWNDMEWYGMRWKDMTCDMTSILWRLHGPFRVNTRSTEWWPKHKSAKLLICIGLSAAIFRWCRHHRTVTLQVFRFFRCVVASDCSRSGSWKWNPAPKPQNWAVLPFCRWPCVIGENIPGTCGARSQNFRVERRVGSLSWPIYGESMVNTWITYRLSMVDIWIIYGPRVFGAWFLAQMDLLEPGIWHMCRGQGWHRSRVDFPMDCLV